MENLTTKDILRGYLDRPLDSVLDLKQLAKIMVKIMPERPEEDHVSALHETLSESHAQNRRQTLQDVDEAQFKTVYNADLVGDQFSDERLSKLIKSLNSLNKSIKDEVKYLQTQYDSVCDELENQIDTLDETPLIKDPNVDLLEQVEAKLAAYQDKLLTKH